MRLDKLLDGIYIGEMESSFQKLEILSIHCDSRKVKKGGLFVALKGLQHNGTDFIKDAIEKGASVIAMGEDAQLFQEENANVCFLHLRNRYKYTAREIAGKLSPKAIFSNANDPKQFLHKIARRLYGNPSNKVRTIGITGTNGKTTVAYLIEALLHEDKKQCGVIGTVNYRWNNTIIPAAQTTPSFLDNQQFLSNLVQRNIPYCVMEVSSHALAQGRVYGIDFHTAVFTNLTSDHLDYHKTSEDYFSAKAQLFTMLRPTSTAVINRDDIYGQQLLSMTKAKIITYGIKNQADVMAKDIQLNISGSCFTLVSAAGNIVIHTKLIGMHNIYNILAAVSVCLDEGMSLDTIKKGTEHLSSVPGRLESVELGQDFSIFIDYAHTQDALENVLTSLRQTSHSRIILVFGCGGDRDQSKRRLMGQVASRLADLSIVTSDNPRSEDPQSIIDQIIEGFHDENFKVMINREKAIEQAVGIAKTDDIVLIAGKGHETYQIFSDHRIDFNERKIIKKCLLC